MVFCEYTFDLILLEKSHWFTVNGYSVDNCVLRNEWLDAEVYLLPIGNINTESVDRTPSSKSSRLEATLETLAQSMLEMKSMMRELLEMQRMLMQAILNKP